MLTLAVDLGGSHVTCAIVREDRIVSCDRVRLAQPDWQPALEIITRSLRRQMQSGNHSSAECQGLSMGFCGLVDTRTNTAVSTIGKFDQAVGFDFSGWCDREFGLPFRVENDAVLALLGEHARGEAQGHRNVAMLTLGTGIGGAVLLDGAPLHNAQGQTCGILGHLPVAVNGRRCVCGSAGCAEAYASTWALTEICRDWTGFGLSSLSKEAQLDFEVLFRHSDAGDSVATEVLDFCCQVWSVLTVAVVHAYDPELVLFGGSLMHRADDILPRIRQRIAGRVWNASGAVTIRQCRLGQEAALYGAPILFEGNATDA
jgi:glucokinase